MSPLRSFAKWKIRFESFSLTLKSRSGGRDKTVSSGRYFCSRCLLLGLFLLLSLLPFIHSSFSVSALSSPSSLPLFPSAFFSHHQLFSSFLFPSLPPFPQGGGGRGREGGARQASFVRKGSRPLGPLPPPSAPLPSVVLVPKASARMNGSGHAIGVDGVGAGGPEGRKNDCAGVADAVETVGTDEKSEGLFPHRERQGRETWGESKTRKRSF